MIIHYLANDIACVFNLLQVNDLREEFAGDMLDSLQALLSVYGVQIMNVSR